MANHGPYRRIAMVSAICVLAVFLVAASGGELEKLRKAAESGDAKAQFDLGAKYQDGEGVAANLPEAVKWYRKAADQGLPKAQFWLGDLYRRGVGVPKDAAEAVKWFHKAAEQGNADGQFFLAWAYVKGEGVTKDDQEAVKWLRKAADQNYGAAEQALGMMYLKGTGVPKDDVQAYKWLDLSGGWEASKQCPILARHMTPEQLAQAKKLSRDWKRRHRAPAKPKV